MIDGALLFLVGLGIGLVFERCWATVCELWDIYREEQR